MQTTDKKISLFPLPFLATGCCRCVGVFTRNHLSHPVPNISLSPSRQIWGQNIGPWGLEIPLRPERENLGAGDISVCVDWCVVWDLMRESWGGYDPAPSRAESSSPGLSSQGTVTATMRQTEGPSSEWLHCQTGSHLCPRLKWILSNLGRAHV